MDQQELIQNLIDRLDRIEAKPSEDEKRENLRDYFAAAALSGIQPEFRSAPGSIISQDCEQLAKYAYDIADAMLKAKSTK